MNAFEQDLPSTRPYLIRALHEWCTDNGFSPYLAVQVDASVRVPMEFVKNGEIVLNVSPDATSGLRLGNDFVEFKARFGGVAREIIVPVTHVVAIYARENGQGMAFPAPAPAALTLSATTSGSPDARGVPSAEVPVSRTGLHAVSQEEGSGAVNPDEPPPKGASSGAKRPQLKRVK
ncbi:MAG: ClpXP protease specificity-enhancing factor [Hydrogenophaga sp.]|nr:ClpXP protease specificity-enhancing factor [Hydrogenophaga sp.]